MENNSKKKRSWLQEFMFEESDNSSPVTNSGQITTPAVTITPTINTITVQPLSVDSEKEKKVIESLLKLLDDSNLEGPDFYEFCIALKEMQKIGGSTEESSLYKMVYTTLKITGLTKQLLVDSGNQYLKILADHLKSFESNHEDTVKHKVGSKITEKSNIEKMIGQKMVQIESLQSEIVGLKNKQQNLESDIQSETKNIEETKNAFIAGYTKLVSELNSNLQKINQHIQ